MKIFDFHTHPKYNTTRKFGFDMTDELFVVELKRANVKMAAGSALNLDIIKESANYGEAIKRLNEENFSFYEKKQQFLCSGNSYSS